MRIFPTLLAVVLLTPSLNAASHMQRSRESVAIRHPSPTFAADRFHPPASTHTRSDPPAARATADNAPAHTTVLAYLIHLIQGFYRSFAA